MLSRLFHYPPAPPASPLIIYLQIHRATARRRKSIGWLNLVETVRRYGTQSWTWNETVWIGICMLAASFYVGSTENIYSYQGLRGSASPLLTATVFVDGRWQFSTPTESTPLDRSPKNLLLVITRRPLRLCQIWCKSVYGGLLANGWNITKFKKKIRELTCQTRRRIFALDGLNDADSRKGMPFGCFVDIAPHFGGEIPQNHHFGGRE